MINCLQIIGLKHEIVNFFFSFLSSFSVELWNSHVSRIGNLTATCLCMIYGYSLFNSATTSLQGELNVNAEMAWRRAVTHSGNDQYPIHTTNIELKYTRVTANKVKCRLLVTYLFISAMGSLQFMAYLFLTSLKWIA